MSNIKSDKLSQKKGRAPVWPDANTEISRRLQRVLPRIGMVKIGEIYFDNMSDKGVSSILSGKTEPPPSALKRISELHGCDLDWLAWGIVKKDDISHSSISDSESNRQDVNLEISDLKKSIAKLERQRDTLFAALEQAFKRLDKYEPRRPREEKAVDDTSLGIAKSG